MCTVSGAVAKSTFLQKDDLKLAALLQQEELLSSLAVKVNTESSKESLDEAWKVSHLALFLFFKIFFYYFILFFLSTLLYG